MNWHRLELFNHHFAKFEELHFLGVVKQQMPSPIADTTRIVVLANDADSLNSGHLVDRMALNRQEVKKLRDVEYFLRKSAVVL